MARFGAAAKAKLANIAAVTMRCSDLLRCAGDDRELAADLNRLLRRIRNNE
jgi:hypothetical protein